jgi:hypothetical protein
MARKREGQSEVESLRLRAQEFKKGGKRGKGGKGGEKTGCGKADFYLFLNRGV